MHTLIAIIGTLIAIIGTLIAIIGTLIAAASRRVRAARHLRRPPPARPQARGRCGPRHGARCGRQGAERRPGLRRRRRRRWRRRVGAVARRAGGGGVRRDEHAEQGGERCPQRSDPVRALMGTDGVGRGRSACRARCALSAAPGRCRWAVLRADPPLQKIWAARLLCVYVDTTFYVLYVLYVHLCLCACVCVYIYISYMQHACGG